MLSGRRQSRRAFTLVELLVVVGIIAVLISILLPALNKARQQAIRTQCLSQMRQLGNALLLYVNENKGKLPVQPVHNVDHFLDQATLDDPSVNKRSVLATLVGLSAATKPMLMCPSAGEIPWNPGSAPTAASDSNYMVNAAVLDKPFGRVRRASEVILFQEDRYRWRVAWTRPARANPGALPEKYNMWCWENPTETRQEYSNIHPTHQTMGRGNLLFCDGHADTKLHRELRASDFGLKGGSGVTGNDTDTNTVAHGTTYYAEY